MTREDTIFDYQRAALMRLVAAVFAVAGLVPGGPVLVSMTVGIRRQVIRVLGPAESALRRLIVIKARGIVVKLSAPRPAPSRPIPKGKGSSDHIPPFALFDRRKWFRELAKRGRPLRGPAPRISGFDEPRPALDPPTPRPSEADIDPASLCRRLQALHKALETIPAQAKRLVRLQARRRRNNEPLKRTEPLRPGWPPGYRRRQNHPVDQILSDCHMFALWVHRPPNTS